MFVSAVPVAASEELDNENAGLDFLTNWEYQTKFGKHPKIIFLFILINVFLPSTEFLI